MTAKASPQRIHALYGASELKHVIQQSTYKGFGMALSLMLVLLLLYSAMMTIRRLSINTAPHVHSVRTMQLPPPPVAPNTPPPTMSAAAPFARAGTPVPVPETLLQSTVQDFANIDEISRALPSGGTNENADLNGLTGEITNITNEVREEEPGLYEYTPVEREPYISTRDLQHHVVYPERAKRAGIEGRVVVRVLVARNGIPKKYVVELSDDELLTESAVQAVMQGIFTPAIQNNKPIECWVSIPIVFRLR